MEDRYAEGFTSAPPDTLSYNHCLVAITRSMNSESSELLLTIFQKLLDVDAEGNNYIEVDKAGKTCHSFQTNGQYSHTSLTLFTIISRYSL